MARIRREAASSQAGDPAIRLPDGAAADVVLGTASEGDLVTVPLFTERGVRAAVLGDAGLPKLLALRALDAGARVQVITSEPAPWVTLRDEAWVPAARMAIAHRTLLPADGTRDAPLLIIDDTGSPAPAEVPRPWRAFVGVPSADGVTIAGLRGLDAILLHRSTPACRAAIIVAMDLPEPVVKSLHGIPRDVVTIARPGALRQVPLTLTAVEEMLLARILPKREATGGPGWSGSPFPADLGSPIWNSKDGLLVRGLTDSVGPWTGNGGSGSDEE